LGIASTNLKNGSKKKEERSKKKEGMIGFLSATGLSRDLSRTSAFFGFARGARRPSVSEVELKLPRSRDIAQVNATAEGKKREKKAGMRYLGNLKKIYFFSNQ
jgi:hypothetical protein